MSESKPKKSCLWWICLAALIVLIVIVILSFAMTSLFDLGVWDEFWDWVRQKSGG